MIYSQTTASTSDNIWGAWNSYLSTSASTLVTLTTTDGTTNDRTWSAWNRHYTLYSSSTAATATTVTLDDPWGYWNRELTVRTGAVLRAAPAPPRNIPSAEDRERWAAEAEQARIRIEAVERDRVSAKEKAEVLLLRHLSPEQRDDLKSKGCFFVEVDGVKYKINRGSHGNVHMLGEGDRSKRSFCIQPTKGCPDGDAMLAQKLLLEADPEEFWRLANVTNTEAGRLISRPDNVLEFKKAHKRAAA
ncbi:MAG: hypothetical protein BWY99_02008 [Synergistetes bacterium ADurb.BinA166]|nr:MAG: hypothetical protein BWY99_02008 [Synergistetes bacterium ADurb.BinA166]